ncbi:hypothetical protein D5S17_08200 [Pseudonocardiaceae bacterium YIM PH 21723]|nr:hypothetical protein D5S17_08200 [Pseudonocardiaceae bacterium YIM PH 21723]
MLKLLLGVAVGYVLGAKAGHERYEQIMKLYRQVADHPAVQGAAGVARAKVSEFVPGTLEHDMTVPEPRDTVIR